MKISNGFLIREIQKVDNKAIETTLSKIMREFDVPETGTALADPELKTIFETYNTKNSIYFILEKINKSLLTEAGFLRASLGVNIQILILFLIKFK